MNNRDVDISEHFRKKLHEQFPLGLIPRKIIGEVTGGILHPRTLANFDCQKKGVKAPITIGRQVYYHVDNVVDFIAARISTKEE